MKKYIQKNFKNIEQIADKNVLYDNNGHIDFDKLELVVKDKSYKEKGFELLVIKWFESFEDTGYLVECLK